MEITDIDPLQYGLLFERFLNPERISMPDIDIDFCMNGRGEVIQYVTEKYGREQVAQIITFNTLGARAAIKDVGRVLDMSFADVERITKLVPNVLNISLKDAMQAEPGFEEARAQRPARRGESSKWRCAWKACAATASVHAAGRGDLARAAENARPALPHQPRRNCHPVRHERPGEAVASQDGFSRPHHAHAHRRRAEADREASRREARARRTAARRRAKLTRSSPKASPAACSSSNRRACATSCAAISPPASKTSPR